MSGDAKQPGPEKTSEVEGSTRILYIDDEPAVARAFAASLKHRGFHVDPASDIEEAVALAEKHRYGVIATDLRMPGTDGLQVIARLHPLQPAAAYMLVTGTEDVRLPDSDAARLVSQVIFKPWETDELTSAITRGLSLHREQLDAKRGRRGEERRVEEGAVLLLEHNEERAKLLSAMLRSGCAFAKRVVHAGLLRDAERLLDNMSFEAAVVALDLPDAPGATAVTELVSARPDMAVLVVGDPGERHLASCALDAGAQFWLPKTELTAERLDQALHNARERKRTELHSEQLAHYDQLTGLPNRVLFREKFVAAQERDEIDDNSSGGAMLLLDIDRLRDINDILGYEVGDFLLRGVTQRLRGCLAGNEVIARLSGDQFGVLIENISGEEEAARVARRLVQTLNKPFRVGEQEVFVTNSIGIVCFTGTTQTVRDLIRGAERAMVRAKSAGRNRYRIHKPEIDGQAARRITLESHLGSALEREQFVLHYQPLIDLATDEVVGAEALIRWHHPERGMVAPGEFISSLEETGLIVEVSDWVIATACAQAKAWLDAGLPPIRVATNIAAVQFEEENLVDTVRRILAETELDVSNFGLEITESALLEDSASTMTALLELRELGVNISLDDFGTGYSSLSYLKRYPIDTLKIDRSFVMDITTDADDAAITRAVIALGKSLRMVIVAEGVETVEQLEFLKNEGCDKYQGFYCSRPLPAADFEAWRRKRDAL